ncbi:MAG: protein O-GlcNAc transferase [Rhodothermales bacterium]|jgi:protein O-GlcNAc transferase
MLMSLHFCLLLTLATAAYTAPDRRQAAQSPAGYGSAVSRAFEAAPAADTTDAERLHGIALSLDAGGDFEMAESFYRRALTLEPGSVRILSGFGNFLFRLGRSEEASQMYTVAISADPESALAHNGLAAVLAEAGRLEEALEAAAEAVRLDPDQVDALTNLGMLMARLGDLDGAVPILRRAVELGYPLGNLALALNLGLVELQRGEYDEAIPLIGAVVVNNPGNADLRVLLARAYLMKGDPVSAMAQLNVGLNAVPGHPGALALIEEIEAAKK